MSYRINLSETEEAELKKIVRENQNRKNVLKRAYCILLKNEGQKNKNIIQLLKIHEDSIADWTKIYIEQGIQGLLKYKYSQRRKSKLAPFKTKIKRMASAKNNSAGRCRKILKMICTVCTLGYSMALSASSTFSTLTP